jgi:hypothetical protein
MTEAQAEQQEAEHDIDRLTRAAIVEQLRREAGKGRDARREAQQRATADPVGDLAGGRMANTPTMLPMISIIMKSCGLC